jgi:MoaA/NifB/PqqE/SkfB family radical SAM enzyme
MIMNNQLDKYFKWFISAAATRFNLKLFSVNLEITKKCNAHCNFCDYWRTDKEQALADYVSIIRHIDPISVVITGGEPLLRNDIVEIVRRLKSNLPLLRLSMITNGISLSENIADSLFSAGLDQLSISLDFLDKRHDRNRGCPGLFDHIYRIAPEIRSRGYNLCLNTIIMKDNLDSLQDIVSWAKDNRIDVSFSCYSDVKNNNKNHLVACEEIDNVRNVINKLIGFKKSYDNILNSDYYLKKIPIYFADKKIDHCQAGLKWVQVTPEGNIKRCSEHPIKCQWKEYNRYTFKATDCGRCWFACRGESQAPFQIERLKKYGKFILNAVRNNSQHDRC